MKNIFTGIMISLFSLLGLGFIGFVIYQSIMNCIVDTTTLNIVLNVVSLPAIITIIVMLTIVAIGSILVGLEDD